MKVKNIFSSKSIAVLPFRNIGKDENEYFSDGITEEIINALTKIEGLKVTARTSSFFYKNKPLDARLIGNELGVESLLEGSVRIINDRVRITAQLIRTDNGFHIWSENFDRNVSDIFELQDEISHKIAEKVRENYGHFVIEDQLSEIGTKSVEAYKFFLKGRAHQLNWHLEDINKAISFYEQSIEIDPNFSDALIAIGWCYGILASWKYINRKEGLILAEEYLNKGVALAPNSATGFYGKATISFWGHWDFKKSLMQLEKSLELNPKLTEAHEAMAEVYTALGEFDRAKSSINLALEINPLSPNHYYTKANIYYLQQQFSKALISLDASLKIDSSFILSIELKTACQILQGDLANFKKHLKQSPQLERPRLCEQIFNLLKGSQVIEIENLEDKNNDVYIENSHLPWSFYLKIYQKEYNEALNILKENTELPTGQFVNFANDPLIEPLRDHQKYNDIKSSVFKGDFLPELNSIKEKIVHSPFEDEELKNFAFQLECAMKEDKGFVNPELSLKELASNIQLHPNKLSWLLNNHFGKNFNDYVNQYRIKEFQQLALKPENQHITLLGLAYDSGFNSKTVFNTFFKKETGMTPKQWLKSKN